MLPSWTIILGAESAEQYLELLLLCGNPRGDSDLIELLVFCNVGSDTFEKDSRQRSAKWLRNLLLKVWKYLHSIDISDLKHQGMRVRLRASWCLLHITRCPRFSSSKKLMGRFRRVITWWRSEAGCVEMLDCTFKRKDTYLRRTDFTSAFRKILLSVAFIWFQLDGLDINILFLEFQSSAVSGGLYYYWSSETSVTTLFNGGSSFRWWPVWSTFGTPQARYWYNSVIVQ